MQIYSFFTVDLNRVIPFLYNHESLGRQPPTNLHIETTEPAISSKVSIITSCRQLADVKPIVVHVFAADNQSWIRPWLAGYHSKLMLLITPHI
jgi:hypothetical protein